MEEIQYDTRICNSFQVADSEGTSNVGKLGKTKIKTRYGAGKKKLGRGPHEDQFR